jgi:hypothetical protein
LCNQPPFPTKIYVICLICRELLLQQQEEALGSSPEQQSVPVFRHFFTDSEPGTEGGRDAHAEQEDEHDRRYFAVGSYMAWCTATLLVFMLMGFLALPFIVKPPREGLLPACRKSAAMTMLPAMGGPGNATAAQLVVWSGMGQETELYSDMHAFDMHRHHWSEVKIEMKPAPAAATPGGIAGAAGAAGVKGGPRPSPRWQEATVDVASPAGMLMYGGDSPSSTPHHDQTRYQNDTWLLSFPGLQWERASSGSVQEGAPSPAARRAHSMTRLKVGRTLKHLLPAGSSMRCLAALTLISTSCGTAFLLSGMQDTKEGSPDVILVFGGRGANGELLNDLWMADVSEWPQITWTQVSAGGKGPGFPPARTGHSAVMRDDVDSPQLVIFGGNNDVTYFGDIWVSAWRRFCSTCLLQVQSVKSQLETNEAATNTLSAGI